jgi:hypothetical protein
VGESLDISFEFQLSMTVAAYCSLKVLIQFFCDWMLHFKAKDIRLWAIEAAGGITHPLAA